MKVMTERTETEIESIRAKPHPPRGEVFSNYSFGWTKKKTGSGIRVKKIKAEKKPKKEKVSLRRIYVMIIIYVK